MELALGSIVIVFVLLLRSGLTISGAELRSVTSASAGESIMPSAALRSPAKLAGAANPYTQLVRDGSPPPGLRLPPAKLSRKSNQVARGRIRWFESYMPSHAVGLRERYTSVAIR